MKTRILVYGAYGYTGDLVVRLAKVEEHDVIVAGRRKEATETLANELGFEARVFDLEDTAAHLADVAVVIHCAGPFSRTATSMVKACLATKTHYTDVTGEVGVFESLMRRDAEAKTAGVMLMPGCGFDVVPSDCLSAHLANRIKDPTHLTLAFYGGASRSHGTATTMVENLAKGCAIRRDGKLVPIRAGSLNRTIDLGHGPITTSAIPWGDLSTAFRSTGIPNITVFTGVKRLPRFAMKVIGFMPWLVGNGPVQRLLKKKIDKMPAGPTAEMRARAKTYLWGEVTNAAGERAETRLTTPEGYSLTAATALDIAVRVTRGEGQPGFQTPSAVFGPDFILSFAGTERVDVE